MTRSESTDATSGPSIIPAPLSRRLTGGVGARFDDGCAIACSPELAGVARWFRRTMERATGWGVDVVVPRTAGEPGIEDGPAAGAVAADAVRATVRLSVDDSLAREAYRLTAGDGRVAIAGGGPAGVFYGLQTLRQLMPASMWRSAAVGGHPAAAFEVAGIELEDRPGFSWRGVHLDVSRHFMPKSFVLRLIDLAAMHKCNVLHLHLTDDQGWRMEIEKYPRLTEVGAWRRESQVGRYSEGRLDGKPHGGFFTKDDLREIVGYAAERFVDVLPEIDMPGHMVAAIAAYPELGNATEHREVMTKWGISTHVLNLEPATIEFCKDVLDEVVDVFPWRYVHTGGDECPVVEWKSSGAAQAMMKEEGFEEERQLQGWFTARIAQHLAERRRVLVGWDEILDGGAPAGAVVMSWQAEQGGIAAASAGHDVVMAPMQWLYFDWAHTAERVEPIAICPETSVERVYGYDPVPSAIPEDRRQHVLGAQCQLWTEYVSDPQHAEYMYFPRLCAFAEVVWCGGRGIEREKFSLFEGRLRDHLDRLGALGVNYRPLDGPTPGQARIWRDG